MAEIYEMNLEALNVEDRKRLKNSGKKRAASAVP